MRELNSANGKIHVARESSAMSRSIPGTPPLPPITPGEFANTTDKERCKSLRKSVNPLTAIVVLLKPQ